MRSLPLLIVTAVVVGGCGQDARDVRSPTPPAAQSPSVSQPRVAAPQQDNPMKQALAAMRGGKALYKDGRYAEARAEFLRAKHLGLHSAATWISACDRRDATVATRSQTASRASARLTPALCSICRGRGNLFAVEGGFDRAQRRYPGPYTGYYNMATCPQCQGAGHVFPDSWSDAQCATWTAENGRRNIAAAERRLR